MNVCENLYLTSFMVNPFQTHLVWWFLLHAFWMRNKNLNCLCKRINEYSQGHLYVCEVVKNYSKVVMDKLVRSPITWTYILVLQQKINIQFIHPFIMSYAIIFVANNFVCLHNIYFVCCLFCDIFSKAINWIFFERYEDDIQCWCWYRGRKRERWFLLPFISYFEDK